MNAPDIQTIALWGDSIPYEYAGLLNNSLTTSGTSYSVDCHAEPGLTSAELAERATCEVWAPTDTVLIHIGTNDWRRGTPLAQFDANLKTLIRTAQGLSPRVLVASIIPDFNGRQFSLSQRYRGTSSVIRVYNKVIEDNCINAHVRYVDLYNLWLQELPKIYPGLKDAIHPNALGQRIIVRGLVNFIQRKNLTIVWPFSGRFANCNYKCPYCYVPTSVNSDRKVYHSVAEWEQAFLNTFGPLQGLTFYLSFGEPTIAPQFMELLEMAGRHPNWEVMVTSNLSTDVKRLKDLELVRSSRLNINASFHPTETKIEKFLTKLDTLREMGIECPVIYVMHPGINLDNFETYFEIFRQAGYLVHLRRFRGHFDGRRYPEAYSMEQIAQFARYMDKASISYMLPNESSLGRLTYLGMHHILVDTDGTIELCDEYPGDRDIGNVFEGRARLYGYPRPFPGPVSLGAVDDIANMIEVGYHELTGNHVTCFAAQGGVYRTSAHEIVYRYEHFDFYDSQAVTAEFRIIPQTQVFDSHLKWFIRHRLIYYVLERNYLRVRQFLQAKYSLLKKGDYRNLFSIHG